MQSNHPRLVPPKDVPTRSPFTTEGRAGLLHAIAHIEFNAINLALDAVWRYPGLPPAYYTDWLRVASEEARRFSLLTEHLASLGHAYGDFDAHDGLWLMARRTAHDVLARMALVPRTLEARGLDAAPPLQDKLARAGDSRAVEILGVILRDEVSGGHRALHLLQAGADRGRCRPRIVRGLARRLAGSIARAAKPSAQAPCPSAGAADMDGGSHLAPWH